jgi:hypothetical protein
LTSLLDGLVDLEAMAEKAYWRWLCRLVVNLVVVLVVDLVVDLVLGLVVITIGAQSTLFFLGNPPRWTSCQSDTQKILSMQSKMEQVKCPHE